MRTYFFSLGLLTIRGRAEQKSISTPTKQHQGTQILLQDLSNQSYEKISTLVSNLHIVFYSAFQNSLSNQIIVIGYFYS